MGKPLPAGFVLEGAKSAPSPKPKRGLPEGFQLEGAPQAKPQQQAAPAPMQSSGKGDLYAEPGHVATSTYAADAGRSFLSGVRSGVEGLAGGIGDITQLNGNVAGWAAGKFGASPETQNTVRSVVSRLSPMPFSPTTENVRSITNPVAGPAYEPQTTAGKYARTVGEFAPSAAAGPGGIARKTAMTAIPAVASEAAGQLTEGTALEPYARAAAAIAGGAGTAGLKTATQNAVLKDASATSKALQAASKDAYTVAEQTVGKKVMDHGTFRRLVFGLNSVATQRGVGGGLSEITDAMHGRSKQIVAGMSDILRGVARGERPAPTYGEIEGVRQTLNADINSMRSVHGHLSADGELLSRFKDKIDEVVMTTPFKGAREAYQTLRKTQRIERAIEDAGTRASSADLAYKNEFRKLLRENRKTKMFSGAELKAIEQVAGHGKLNNLLEGIGRAGFSKANVFTPIAAGVGGYAALGPLGALAPVVTTAAKVVGTRMTKNAAGRARDIVALGPKNMKGVNAKLTDAAAKRLARRGLLLQSSGVSTAQEK